MDDFATKEAKNWAMVCHLASLLGMTGIPFANIIGPVVVWLIKREESAFIDYHGREAVNFQISVTLYLIIPIFLSFFVIGLPLVFIIGLAALILIIIAAVKAASGEYYEYPLTIRFIKKPMA